MGSARIIHPGVLTTIQDEGRSGLLYYAIPASGVMDRGASRLANQLLGNLPDSPILECTVRAPSLEFQSNAAVCLTGADARWTVNNHPVPLNSVLILLPGDILKGNFLSNGMRAYIGVKGELEGEEKYGSKATYLPAGIGGFKGRALQKGDILKWNNQVTCNPGKLDNPGNYSNNSNFRFFPGPEFHLFTPKSKDRLSTTAYIISPNSNRMGLRLMGPKLKCKSNKLKVSVAVFPGCIQLPPDGQPIILLRDAQVTGGYPRIGYITEQEINRIAQRKLGSEVRFNLEKSS